MRSSNRLTTVRAGFTLIELMVVMVILVLLAGVVSTIVVKRIDEARRAKAVADIDALEQALEQYYLHNGDYPTTEQGLIALREKPTSSPVPKNWDGPYVKKSIPSDPWGTPYIYLCPGEHNQDGFDLSSLGKDGREGGEGNNADITNWEQ